jgi:hypothetical protein
MRPRIVTALPSGNLFGGSSGIKLEFSDIIIQNTNPYNQATAVSQGNNSTVTIDQSGIRGSSRAIQQGDNSSANVKGSEITAPTTPVTPSTERHIPQGKDDRAKLVKYLSATKGAARIFTTSVTTSEPSTYAKEWSSVLNDAGWRVVDHIDVIHGTPKVNVCVAFYGETLANGKRVKIGPTSPQGVVLNALKSMGMAPVFSQNAGFPKDEIWLIIGGIR